MRVLVLYGSQTGCSADVSRRIYREARRMGFTITLSSMDEFPIAQLPQQDIVLFICSTTGQGQVPDNMSKFWQFLLRSDLPQGCLENIRFSIFGLGDRSYPLYNAVARRLQQRLLHLGACEFSPIGLGDDQHAMGYDGGLIPWLSQLWESLRDLTIERLTVLYTNELDSPESVERYEHILHQLDINIQVATMSDQVQTSSSSTNSASAPQNPINYLAAPSVCVHVLRHGQAPQDLSERYPYIGAPIAPFNVNIQNYYQYPIPSIYDDDIPQGPPETSVASSATTLTATMRKLPLLAAHRVTASTNPQIVDHISFDCSSLLASTPAPSPSPLPSYSHTYPQQQASELTSTPASSSTPSPHTTQPMGPSIDDLVADPPYLPGDVLEVLAPNCNSLVNAALTLYGLHPNDIICISKQTTIYEQTIERDGLYLITQTFPPNQQLSSSYDGQKYHNGSHSPSPSSSSNETALTSSSIPAATHEPYPNFPQYIRAWQLFTWYCNLILTPQRHIFFILAQIASDPQEKERLQDLCTVDYASTLDAYCIRERRSIVEVMTDFPSAVLPLNWFIELFDRLKPRQFSLASSPLYDQIQVKYSHNNKIYTQRLATLVPSSAPFSDDLQLLPQPMAAGSDVEAAYPSLTGSICMGVVEYTTPFKRRKAGVCSMYLHQLTQSNEAIDSLCLDSITLPSNIQLDTATLDGETSYLSQDMQTNTPSASPFTSSSESSGTASPRKSAALISKLTLAENDTEPLHQIAPSTRNNNTRREATSTTISFSANAHHPSQPQNNAHVNPSAVLSASTQEKTQDQASHTNNRYDKRNDGYTVNIPYNMALLDGFISFPASWSMEDLTSLSHVSPQQFPSTNITADAICPWIMGRIKPGSFRYNVTDLNPMLLVGPGTGIAAFHAIAEHRLAIHTYFSSFENSDSRAILGSPKCVLGPSSDGNEVFTFIPSCPTTRLQVMNPTTANNDAQQHIVSLDVNSDAIQPSTAARVLIGRSLPQVRRQPVKVVNDLGPISLLFGCRYSDGDHYYRDFFNYCVRIGILTGYHAVYSRKRACPSALRPYVDQAYQLIYPHLSSTSHVPTPLLASDIGGGTDDDDSDYVELEHSHRKRSKSSPSFEAKPTSLASSHSSLLADMSKSGSDSISSGPYPPPLDYADGVITTRDADSSTLDQKIDPSIYLPFSPPFEQDKYVQHRLVRKHLRDYLTTKITTASDPSMIQQYLHPPEHHETGAAGNPDRNADTPETTMWERPEIPITADAGVIIVAGNAKKMPVDVQLQISYVISHMYKLSEDNAKKYVNQLARQGRYLLECWM